MFQKIRILSQELIDNFDQIPFERKELLKSLGLYIQEKYDVNEIINLVYICTHNSRRSHFGQVSATLAAAYYNIDKVRVFSGGTETTSMHPNATNALEQLGFEIDSDSDAKNPKYNIKFGEFQSTVCFSKKYDDVCNPSSTFVAIMTCSDAEQNCPFITGVALRVGTTYEDPKKSDGHPNQQQVYLETFKQIATETLYAFSLVK